MSLGRKNVKAEHRHTPTAWSVPFARDRAGFIYVSGGQGVPKFKVDPYHRKPPRLQNQCRDQSKGRLSRLCTQSAVMLVLLLPQLLQLQVNAAAG